MSFLSRSLEPSSGAAWTSEADLGLGIDVSRLHAEVRTRETPEIRAKAAIKHLGPPLLPPAPFGTCAVSPCGPRCFRRPKAQAAPSSACHPRCHLLSLVSRDLGGRSWRHVHRMAAKTLHQNLHQPPFSRPTSSLAFLWLLLFLLRARGDLLDRRASVSLSLTSLLARSTGLAGPCHPAPRLRAGFGFDLSRKADHTLWPGRHLRGFTGPAHSPRMRCGVEALPAGSEWSHFKAHHEPAPCSFPWPGGSHAQL